MATDQCRSILLCLDGEMEIGERLARKDDACPISKSLGKNLFRDLEFPKNASRSKSMKTATAFA